jgi:hypothetical protein
MLQHQLEEYQDLDEAKAAFEEYQQHSTQELDEGLAKLEEEKQALQNERYKMLKDRSNIDEKESRIGLLITNLDEKESKLRQMMGTMKEQQDQWQRSITDLQVLHVEIQRYCAFLVLCLDQKLTSPFAFCGYSICIKTHALFCWIFYCIPVETRGPSRRLANQPHDAREPPERNGRHARTQIRRTQQARG